MHGYSRGIKSQSRCSKRSKTVQDIEGVDRPLLLVTSNLTLDTAVHALDFASDRVELFFGKHGVLLNVVTDNKHWRESIGELQDAQRADE